MALMLFNPDKYQVTTSAAGSVKTVAHYTDATTIAGPVVQGDTAGTTVTNITTAATTDVVPAPASGDMRNVKYLSITNMSASVANDVTVVIDRSATDTEVYPKVNLLPGEALIYEPELGWFKHTNGFDSYLYARKSSDQTFASTSVADVTGLGFAVSANGVYVVEYEITWTSATVTVGVGLGINGPASPTSVQGTVAIWGGNPTTTISDIASVGFAAYDTVALTTTTAIINTSYGAYLRCLIENGGTAGTVIPRWKSETATNTVVKAGSYGTCRRVA